MIALATAVCHFETNRMTKMLQYAKCQGEIDENWIESEYECQMIEQRDVFRS